jgi:hypothetical protein
MSCDQKSGDLTTLGCFAGGGINQGDSNASILSKLQTEYTVGKKIEPLVLRAAAGQCITVKLRNHLPQPEQAFGSSMGVLQEKDAYHNFLPMIADGFNLNQFRMSHTVGISPSRVAQNPVAADGTNAGLNSAALQATKPIGAVHKQGSLIAPCSLADNANVTVSNRDCSYNYVWSATDLQRSESAQDGKLRNVATEFGALPLRSFGDAIKHPTHGLIGALIIGPEGSKVCDSLYTHSGGTSRKVCTRDGKHYGDHVLVMQDAVSMTQGGFPVPDLHGAEEPDDYGVKAINYKTEPLWARRGNSPSIEFGDRNTSFDYTAVFSSRKQGSACESGAPANGNGPNACDPETPVFKAKAGEPIRLHFVHPGGHTRQQGLTISGHGFHPYPWSNNSTVLSNQRCWPDPGNPLPEGCLLWQGVFNGFGPMMGQTFSLRAGGTSALAKDYLVRSQASFLLDGGLWSILRVTP